MRLLVPSQYFWPESFRINDLALGLGCVPYVLFLGRLNEIKGPDLLLDAFCRIADRCAEIHLVLAGPDGRMLQRLRAKSKALGIAARVHFAGYLGGRSKVAALRGASLLAIPSRREAMSIVVLEAGVCGCPANSPSSASEHAS